MNAPYLKINKIRLSHLTYIDIHMGEINFHDLQGREFCTRSDHLQVINFIAYYQRFF